MDALLRQAAQSTIAPENSKSTHLDADEISLFAENALPKKLRARAVLHFADCDRCRMILSGLIAENAENEIVFAKPTEISANAIPWYRKFFAVPKLAYTLGALVLVFSGVIAFTVLQSGENSQNSEVSRVSERQIGGKGMSSDGEAVTVERNAETSVSNSMSSAAMSNSASSALSNATMSNASSNTAARSSGASAAAGNASPAANKPSVSATATPKAETRTETEATKNVAADSSLQGVSANNLSQEKRERTKEEDKKTAETTDMTKSALVPPPKPSELSVDNGAQNSAALRATTKKKAQPQSLETTSVGGKTFKRADNVWIDSAYKGQATKNIARGTKEYKKLDSALRLIAENLGGTLIIVWKEKTYRIQ